MRLIRLLLLALVPATLSCDRDVWAPDDLLQGKSPREQALLAHGREQYTMYCAGCHGPAGDGEGPAAKFLSPKPRDLRKGRVKFAAVAAGSMPRDEDIIRTMTRGLRGTSMPSWHLLAAEDKVAIVAYIKTFSEAWTKEPPAPPVALKPDPWRRHPDRGVEEGERVYHGMAQCSSCHPAYVVKPKLVEHMKAYDLPYSGFRADLYSSVEKDSEWGMPIKPPDFLADMTKSSTTVEDLAQVIASGIGGTAMPSWGDALTSKQLWGLAYYVDSLMQKRGTQEGKDLKAALLDQPPFAEPKDGSDK